MSDWQARLIERLEPLLTAPDPRQTAFSAYHDMPYAIFQYPPESELELRHELSMLRTRLNQKGKHVVIISMAEVAFALWMRAQRAYNDLRINKDERPPITKSNIVVAEPMPGEEDLFKEFLRSLKEDRLESLIRDALKVSHSKQVRATKAMADSLCDVVRIIWDTMKLAGEAGSLLQVDTDLASAIAKGREEWEEKLPLFRVTEYGLNGDEKTSFVRHVPGEDADFWSKSETLVLHALRAFARGAAQTTASSFRRGLFADDAARGLAFLDIVRCRFDSVLMNPPFGKASERADDAIRTAYPTTWKELYAAFLDRSRALTGSNGWVGAITSSQYLHTKQMRGLREEMLEHEALDVFVELGDGVLDDAAVKTGLSVLDWGRQISNRTGVRYLDLSTVPAARESALVVATREHRQFAFHRLSVFSRIPEKPFAFHAHPRLLDLWRGHALLDPDIATVATGNHTFDDERFLRLRIEIPPSLITRRWQTFEKGGEYQPFFASAPLVLDWIGNGDPLRELNRRAYGTDAQVMQSSIHWGKPGLSYSHVSSVAFGPRVLPAGLIFSSESIGIFPHRPANAVLLLALLSCSLSQELIWVFGRYRKIENRAVSGLPLELEWFTSCKHELESLCNDAIRLVVDMESMDETTAVFVCPDLVRDRGRAVLERRRCIADQLCMICDTIDERIRGCLDQLSEIELAAPPRSSLVSTFVNRDVAEPVDTYRGFVSYLIGVVLGRFDIRFATNEGTAPPIRDPFAPLPLCSPAMLAGEGGFPLLSLPEDYPLSTFLDGIAVDDPGHARDLAALVRQACEVIYPSRCDELLKDLEKALAQELREWLARKFFDFHLKQYSKSRRRAPVYWQLVTPSARYSVWLYYHYFTPDTFFKVLNDYVKPKLDHERRKLDRLRTDAGPSPARSQRSDLEQQEVFVAELKTVTEEVERIAPMWNPDLNDGVKINFAPLWRLVSLHKAWQKECKECWDSLVAGKYDWAHLAMHLWPERVVSKCQRDASIAIAHGLADLFWIKEEDKWRALREPSAEIEYQKKRRTTVVREQFLKSLAALAKSEVGERTTSSVWQSLRDGQLDDRKAAVWLWPNSVIEKARYDQTIANVHEIKQREVASSRSCEQLKKRYNTPELEQLRAAAEAYCVGRDTTLRTTWEALTHGEFDDQALALELWPDRVIDKCLEDISLAEKHNLRDYFWYNAPDKGWRLRQDPEEEIAWESGRRYNRTVKDALEKFLSSPTPDGGNKRGRSKAAKASAFVDDASTIAAGKRKPKVAKVRNESEELF